MDATNCWMITGQLDCYSDLFWQLSNLLLFIRSPLWPKHPSSQSKWAASPSQGTKKCPSPSLQGGMKTSLSFPAHLCIIFSHFILAIFLDTTEVLRGSVCLSCPLVYSQGRLNIFLKYYQLKVITTDKYTVKQTERGFIKALQVWPGFMSVPLTRDSRKSNLRKKGFTWLSTPGYCPILWRSQDNNSNSHITVKNTENNHMDNCLFACCQLAFFFITLFRTACLGNGTTHSRKGLSTSNK